MHTFRLAAVLLTWVLVSCGGGDGPSQPNPPGSGGTGTFRARIDGQLWESGAGGSNTIGVQATLPGLFSMTGVQVGGYVLSIQLANIGATGTYPLGVTPSVAGGTLIVSNASGGWSTPLNGEAGSITVTTLTSSRIAGTFNATAAALTGSATGTRSVTQGEFNLEVKTNGTLPPLPENAGSKLSATVAGTSFNASAVSGNFLQSSELLVVTGNNGRYSTTLTLGGISQPGTYALSTGSPTRTLGVSITEGSTTQVWTSGGAGGSGSVTITSITNSRIRGTFSGTVVGAPGTSLSPMVITNGTFDFGR